MKRIAVVTLLAVSLVLAPLAMAPGAAAQVPTRGEAPGKICKKPGMTVQTPKFGKLTCKAGRWQR